MTLCSSAAAVKLFVNNELIGIDSIPDNGYVYKFDNVQWKSGEIRAEGFIDNVLRTSQVKNTIGEPVAIKLTPITGPKGWLADGSDVALIDLEVVDKVPALCRKMGWGNQVPRGEWKTDDTPLYNSAAAGS